jgi:kynurenine formamidase
LIEEEKEESLMSVARLTLPVAVVYLVTAIAAQFWSGFSLKVQAETSTASGGGCTDSFLNHLAGNQLRIVDLSHVINGNTPDFFGDKDIYHYEHKTLSRSDGYATGAFETPEHYGTHVDAPIHFTKGTATVDQIPAAHLVLPAVVIDVHQQAEKNPDFELTPSIIQDWEKQHGKIPSGAAVLLMTGWPKYWESEKQYRNVDAQNRMHFPGYSEEAAKFLIEDRNSNCLGTDTLSIDAGQSQTFPVHKITSGHQVYTIENLNNLDKLPTKGILLFCGPLAIEGGSGCPARTLAIVDRKD